MPHTPPGVENFEVGSPHVCVRGRILLGGVVAVLAVCLGAGWWLTGDAFFGLNAAGIALCVFVLIVGTMQVGQLRRYKSPVLLLSVGAVLAAVGLFTSFVLISSVSFGALASAIVLLVVAIAALALLLTTAVCAWQSRARHP